MITEDYVSFDTAKLLKEKGFYQDFYNSFMPVWHYNGNNKVLSFTEDDSYPSETQEWYSAPTLQVAMKWLREEKDVQIEISIVGTDTWESPTKWMYGFRCQTKDVIDRRNADFSSYEEACEAAIKYCLENLI